MSSSSDITQELKDTENALRDFLAGVLQNELGPKWIEQSGVSSERIQKWRERKETEEKRQEAGVVDERLIYYADFYDLKTILVITEHDKNSLIYDPSYLDIQRTDGVIFIQITLNEGRTIEVKKAFYKTVAERLNKELGVRMEDVFISLVEVKKENWSFGNGVAQYA